MEGLKCPLCGGELYIKEGEPTAVCKSCGSEVGISISVTMPPKESPKEAGGSEKNTPAGGAQDLSVDEGENAASASGEKPSAPMINVFGPAAIALGVLTIAFAFLAGINAIVLGICGVIASALGFFANILVKEIKKWMPAAGLILNAVGIILAIIIRNGFVF